VNRIAQSSAQHWQSQQVKRLSRKMTEVNDLPSLLIQQHGAQASKATQAVRGEGVAGSPIAGH